MYIIENPMLDLSTYFIAVLNLTITMENEKMNCFCYEVTIKIISLRNTFVTH